MLRLPVILYFGDPTIFVIICKRWWHKVDYSTVDKSWPPWGVVGKKIINIRAASNDYHLYDMYWDAAEFDLSYEKSNSHGTPPRGCCSPGTTGAPTTWCSITAPCTADGARGARGRGRARRGAPVGLRTAAEPRAAPRPPPRRPRLRRICACRLRAALVLDIRLK